MEILYIALVFFIIALALKILGPSLGIGGGDMAFRIAIIFVIIFVVVWLVSLLLGSGGGFGHLTI